MSKALETRQNNIKKLKEFHLGPEVNDRARLARSGDQTGRFLLSVKTNVFDGFSQLVAEA